MSRKSDRNCPDPRSIRPEDPGGLLQEMRVRYAGLRLIKAGPNLTYPSTVCSLPRLSQAMAFWAWAGWSQVDILPVLFSAALSVELTPPSAKA